jgi:hypothetical protein
MPPFVCPPTARHSIDFSADRDRQDRAFRRRGSWITCVEIPLLVTLASCSTQRTPNVCCTSDTECAQLGLPPGSPSEYSCNEGLVCRDFYCVEPPVPIVDNGQPAELVLGQETFDWGGQNTGGISARSLYWPTGVAADEAGRVWVLDTGNCRALMWSPAPATSFAEAALVVGSADFSSLQCSCEGSRGSVGSLWGAPAAHGGKLLIPAASCNRVTIWNPAPTTNSAEASTALGQGSFYASLPGNGAGDLDGPAGVWTDGIRVAVADARNNRVLIWTSFPRTSKQPADIVLGQQGFGTSGFPATPTGATMRSPNSVYSDGVQLFVSDSGNNRVLVWRSFPTTNGQAADFVIGQPDLTSDRIGLGATRLAHPTSVTSAGDHLFIVDSQNYRVQVYSPIPTASGASASFVLGQPTLDLSSPVVGQETMVGPTGVTVSGNKLYVTDFLANRVLRFELRL